MIFRRDLDRRTFLRGVGAVGLAGLGAAGCASDDEPLTGGIDLVLLFSPAVLAAGRPERLSFGLKEAGANGSFILGTGGGATVRLLNGATVMLEEEVEGRVVAHDHPDGEDVHQHESSLKYFSIRPTFPVAGSYTMQVEWRGQQVELSVPVNEVGNVAVPGVGDPMPVIATPTSTDPMGVDPLCTRRPSCEFHQMDLAQALGDDGPVAFLVATPAFCQTAFCGPVLDVMIKASADYPDINFLHAEVYSNPNDPGGLLNPDLQPSPAMLGLGLSFEPSLFLIDGDGIVHDRIDNVFDDVELADALDSLSLKS